MKNTYFDLIDQSYDFPQEGFDLEEDTLNFHGVSLKALIEKYGTPFRFMFLPKIGQQITKAKSLFEKAFARHDYKGSYVYCYCTKCNHFSHVLSETLKHDIHLETSSALDIDLIEHLYKAKKLDKSITIIHNGYKTDEYLKKIISLHENMFHDIVVILDNKLEISRLCKLIKGPSKIKIGLRMAISEAPKTPFYTSRLGIRHNDILSFYDEKIEGNDKVELKMLHFFVDSGIRDDIYYWGEFRRALELYIQLKKKSSSIDSLNVGGGFPIRNNLGFEYNYSFMIDTMVRVIKESCLADNVAEPNIYTEFGKYTVGESGATIFEVLAQKEQNEKENWYIINNSLMHTIPDAWSLHEKFILLPINKWNHKYRRAHIGGISCDHYDYYNSDDGDQEVFLPHYHADEAPLYIGFFHTGAYQDALGGYGGIKHCLIPSLKHVIVGIDEAGRQFDYLYEPDRSVEEMYRALGYDE